MPGRAEASPSARLHAPLLRRIVDAARAALPNEAVGLLAADRHFTDGGTPSRYVALHNAAASPYRYSIAPAEQLAAWLEAESRHEVVWGIVHSHVSTPAVPSATDVELAYFPESVYLVCSLVSEPPTVRAWSIRDGAVRELPLVVS